MKKILIVGSGVIGGTLCSILSKFKKEFEIDEVILNKNTPLKSDKENVKQLLSQGCVLSTDDSKFEEFKKLGIDPKYGKEQAIDLADLIVDCTPKGIGLESKRKYYDKYITFDKSFIAQGSETGFGKPFAYNINNEALNETDQFVQVVSCNTHGICSLMKTFWNKNPYYGDFVCIRRASDISQNEDFIPGIEVNKHSESMKSHHAIDALRVFKTIPQPRLWHNSAFQLRSSACIVPSQYMHAIRFSVGVQKLFDGIHEVTDLFAKNRMVALTEKMTSNSIFSFGREYGYYGRILNQIVVPVQTLSLSENMSELQGFCFIPQDSNSIISSIAATLWFLNDKKWDVVEEKLNVLNSYIFKEI